MQEEQEDTRHVRVGEQFEIELRESPSTGHEWKGLLNKKMLTLVNREWHPIGDKIMTGGSGTVTFTFKALARGETHIKFRYVQPWLDITEEEKIVPVKIT